jgi:hypothetical protein
MTGSGRPLHWAEIEVVLREVGDELERRQLHRRSIVIVGGAFAAQRNIRRATTDVDVIGDLDADIRSAAAVVARRHGLAEDWLNDRARPWRPATFDEARCHHVFVHGALAVLTASVDDVVLMKIAAGNRTPNDQVDLRALWPDSSFTTAAEAASAFYEAFPNEEIDPYLADWIAQIVAS